MPAPASLHVLPSQAPHGSDLQPCWGPAPGDGSQDHLDEPAPAPGPVQLKDGVFEVGRAEPADILIAIPTVSTRHALLRVGESDACRCVLA
jgi:hypothetical protein